MGNKLAKYAKEKGVKFFMISYTDLFGSQRAKLVPATMIDDMEDDGAGFAGFATWLDLTAAHPDMMAVPDPVSQDALALAVLSAVLDGHSGARLERALVQGSGMGGKRIADSAGASYALTGRGPQLFLLSAVPAQDVDGVVRVHELIRADTRTSLDEATEASLAKAKLAIDQLGDTLFR